VLVSKNGSLSEQGMENTGAPATTNADYSTSRGDTNSGQPNQSRGNYNGAVPPGTYYIRNVHTGTALDLSGASAQDGTRVIGYQVTGGQNQKVIEIYIF